MLYGTKQSHVLWSHFMATSRHTFHGHMQTHISWLQADTHFMVTDRHTFHGRKQTHTS